MKIFLAICFCFGALCNQAQSNDQQIRSLLNQQTAAWNHGDIAGFMEGYWKNDSLLFVGKSGANYGWQKTLENYKKNYPDTVAMGKLKFDVLQVKFISEDYCFVLGKWFLKRAISNIGGHFTLILRKFKNGWKITTDHSSSIQ